MKRPVLWTFCATLMAIGASWLVALLWRTASIDFLPVYARYVIGAAILGLTLARVLDRRRSAMVIAVIAMTAWIALQLAMFLLDGRFSSWALPFAGSSLLHYALAALFAIPTAALAASPRLRGRADHPLLWLWIAGLVLLGSLVLPLMLLARSGAPGALSSLVALVAPFVAGAIVQVLAPYRVIWTCGGGAVMFALLLLDKGFFSRAGVDVIGSLLGIGACVLLGAAGARVGWYLFRKGDLRTAPALPTATTTI